MWPLESSITRSATRAISRLCVTTRTVFPAAACCCSSSRIATPVRKSSSPVGSSASSTELPVASARAIATRCCSPPESWCAKWFSRPASPTCARVSAATSRASARPATSAPNCTFSRAVRPGNRLKLWKMKLTVCRRSRARPVREAAVMSWPATRTRPSVATSSAPMRFSNVVLPLPDGPRITTKAASSTCRSTCSSAVTVTSPTR